MVVETSAMVAIILEEDDFEELVRKILHASIRVFSAANYLEICMVLTGNGAKDAMSLLDDALEELGVEVLAVTSLQAKLAADAFLGYGKGCHPARLNSATAFLMLWQSNSTSRSSSPATTSPELISSSPRAFLAEV